jgi:hypothetical protein
MTASPAAYKKIIKSGAVDMEGCLDGGWNVHISIQPTTCDQDLQ